MARVDELAKVIWNYHLLNQPVKKADLIFVLGSANPVVAKRAAELYLEGYAPLIVFSGGFGRMTREVFNNETEAVVFKKSPWNAAYPSRQS